MPVIQYRDVPKNPLVAPNSVSREGAPVAFDTDSGHLFDAKGNTVGKLVPADDAAIVQQRNTGLAQHCSQMMAATAAYAQGTAYSEDARDRASHMLSSLGGTEHLHCLDIGTGDVHIPSALPNIAMGYRNEPPMADIYSPPVMVPKPADNYWVFDKNDAYQRAYSNGGTGGGNVPEVSPRLASTLFNTTERALGGFVSTQVQSAADAPLQILQATTNRILAAMLLEREIRVQSLARTTATWNTNNVAALTGNFIWNGGSASDPVKDLQNRVENSLMSPTGILMAFPTFNAYIRNPAVRALYPANRDNALPDAAWISKNFGLPPIYVAKMKYIGSAGTPVYVWGGDVVLFRQPEQMPPATQDDIASSYSFRWNMNGRTSDMQASSAGGFIVRQYFEQYRGSLGGMKTVVVHQDAEVQTSSLVGGLLTGAFT